MVTHFLPVSLVVAISYFLSGFDSSGNYSRPLPEQYDENMNPISRHQINPFSSSSTVPVSSTSSAASSAFSSSSSISHSSWSSFVPSISQPSLCPTCQQNSEHIVNRFVFAFFLLQLLLLVFIL
jgi:hypothetical protein